MPVKLSDIRSGDDSDDLCREKGSAEDSGIPDSSRRPKSRKALAPTSLGHLSSSPYTRAFREAERLKAMLPRDNCGMERSAVAQMAKQLAQNKSLGMADLAARQFATVSAAGSASGVSDSLQEIVRRLAIDNQPLAAAMGPSYSGEQMRAAAASWRQIAESGTGTRDTLTMANLLRGIPGNVTGGAFATGLSDVLKSHAEKLGDLGVLAAKRSLSSDLADLLRSIPSFQNGAVHRLADSIRAMESEKLRWVATIAQAAVGVATRGGTRSEEELAGIVGDETRTAVESVSLTANEDEASSFAEIAASAMSAVEQRTGGMNEAERLFVWGLIFNILIALCADFSSTRNHTEDHKEFADVRHAIGLLSDAQEKESHSSMERKIVSTVRSTTVRDAPQASGKRIGTLFTGCEVELLLDAAGWYWVRPTASGMEGLEGWVSARNLRPIHR